MTDLKLAAIALAVLVILVKLFAKDPKDREKYQVIKVFPDDGYEVRQNSCKVWVEVLDQEKFDAYLMRIRDEVMKDLEESNV